jgi:hypothetical protein
MVVVMSALTGSDGAVLSNKVPSHSAGYVSLREVISTRRAGSHPIPQS